MFFNSAPIYWFLKKQTSIESSSFGSELIATKQLCDYLRGIIYKLQMIGIPVEGTDYIEGDNRSFLTNTKIQYSTTNKNSKSIEYHLVREGVAREERRTAYVSNHANDADIITKKLPSGEK